MAISNLSILIFISVFTASHEKRSEIKSTDTFDPIHEWYDTLCLSDGNLLDLDLYLDPMIKDSLQAEFKLIEVVRPIHLLISEYIEGSGNNKCLELYNGTFRDIDLTEEEYSIQFYFNGSHSPGKTIRLNGNMAHNETFVLCDDSVESEAKVKSDTLVSGTFFNGDDAVILLSGQDTLDVIGRIGEDPGSGWSQGEVRTNNRTLRRKPLVIKGDTVTSNPYNPSFEWTAHSIDEFMDLGNHVVEEPTEFLKITNSDSVTIEDSLHVLLLIYDSLTQRRDSILWHLYSFDFPELMVSDISNGCTDSIIDLNHAISQSMNNIGNLNLEFYTEDGVAPGRLLPVIPSPIDSSGRYYLIYGKELCFDTVSFYVHVNECEPLPEQTTPYIPPPEPQTIILCHDSEEHQITRVTPRSLKFAPELFISQYLEGPSFDKCIEIFNYTGMKQTLDSFSLQLFTNGATHTNRTLSLAGSIDHNGTFVICHPASDSGYLERADLLDDEVCNFNGDDVIVFYNGSGIIDVFGQLGHDPGLSWTQDGVSSRNQNLVRKKNIIAGDVNAVNLFDPSQSWENVGLQTYHSLGRHDVEPSYYENYNFYDLPPASNGRLIGEHPHLDTVVDRSNSPVTIYASAVLGRTEGPASKMMISVHPGTDYMACYGQVDLKMDANCQYTLDPSQFMLPGFPYEFYEVKIFDGAMEVHLNAEPSSHFGKKYRFEVRDICTDLDCSGEVMVTNEANPTIVHCPCRFQWRNLSPTESVPRECIVPCFDSIHLAMPDLDVICSMADPTDLLIKEQVINLDCDTTVLLRYYIQRHKHKPYDTLCAQRVLVLPIGLSVLQLDLPDLDISCNIDQDYSPSYLSVDHELYQVGPYYNTEPSKTIPFLQDHITCGLKIRYTDVLFQRNCQHDVFGWRDWSILEFCTGTIVDSTQLIRIGDLQPPDFNLISVESFITNDSINDSISTIQIDLDKILYQIEATDARTCGADWPIPTFDQLSDNCTQPDDIKLEFVLPIGVNVVDDTVRNLPVGVNTVKAIATDECENTREQVITIVVLDKSPPIADCLGHFDLYNLQLTSQGLAKVPVEALDRTRELCGSIPLRIARRLDSKFRCNHGPLKFIGTDYLEFCCEDIGMLIPVSLTVFDSYGNSSICTLNVEVHGNLPASIPCPAEIESCERYNSSKITSVPVMSHFSCVVEGSYHMDSLMFQESCRKKEISRKWFDNEDQLICIQRVTLQKESAFDPFLVRWPLHHDGTIYHSIKSENGDQDRNTLDIDLRIRKTEDTHIPGMTYQDTSSLPALKSIAMNPSINCWPIPIDSINLQSSPCDVVTLTHEDVYTSSYDSGQFIFRSWVLIDWCTYVPNSRLYPETFFLVDDQVERKSYFLMDEERTISDGFYQFDQILQINYPTRQYSSCGDTAVLIADVYNNPTIRRKFWPDSQCDEGIFSVVISENGKTIQYIDQIPMDSGYIEFEFEISDTGLYEMLWTDHTNHDIQYHCKQWLKIDPLVDTTLRCEAKIRWVAQLCPSVLYPYEITDVVPSETSSRFSIRDSLNNPLDSLIIPCNTDEDTLKLQLTLLSQSDTGVEKHCPLEVVIPSNSKQRNIYGQISMTDGSPLHGALIKIEDDHRLIDSARSNEIGLYDIAIGYIDRPLTLSAEFQDVWTRGLSISDLILLRSHLSGQRIFEYTWQYIAADLNFDNQVTLADYMSLESLLAGNTSALVNRSAWIFIEALKAHDSIQSFLSSHEISINPEKENCDLVAIKLGDLNGSWMDDSHSFGVHHPRWHGLSTIHTGIKTDYISNRSISLAAVGFRMRKDRLNELRIESKYWDSEGYESLKIDADQKSNHIYFFNTQDKINPGSVVFSTYSYPGNQHISQSKGQEFLEIQLYEWEEGVLKVSSGQIEPHVSKGWPDTPCKLWPNPFREFLEISLSYADRSPLFLKVFDMEGDMIYNRRFDSSSDYGVIRLSEAMFKSAGPFLIMLQDRYGVLWSEKVFHIK